jgi:predicted transcriptional regulator
VELSETLIEALTCCFKLTETDILVLKTLIAKGKASSEELAEVLKVSKTTVSNSMKRLMESNLVLREKDQQKKMGRPRYNFYVNPELEKVIRERLEHCSKKFSSLAQ